MDINVPIVYLGGDDFSTLANAKSMTEQALEFDSGQDGCSIYHILL